MTTSTPAPGNGPAGQRITVVQISNADGSGAGTSVDDTAKITLWDADNKPVAVMSVSSLATLRREKEELRKALERLLSYLEHGEGRDPKGLRLISARELCRAILARTSDDSGKERE